MDDTVVGHYGENMSDNNAKRLTELCYQYFLRIINGWFKRKDIHLFAWRIGKQKSIIDFIMKQNIILRLNVDLTTT